MKFSRILTHLVKECVFSGIKGRFSLFKLIPIYILAMVKIKLLKSELAIARGVRINQKQPGQQATGLPACLGGCSVESLSAVGCFPKESLGPHTQHSFILLKKKMFWKRRGGGSSSPSREKNQAHH